MAADHPDVTVEDRGSIWVFHADSEAGADWLRDRVVSSAYQWEAGGLAIDHRYAADLVAAMRDDGLSVSGPGPTDPRFQ